MDILEKLKKNELNICYCNKYFYQRCFAMASVRVTGNELSLKECPRYFPGAICTKEGCNNLVNPDPLRSPGACKVCLLHSPRDPNCWCCLCGECKLRPIGTEPVIGFVPK